MSQPTEVKLVFADTMMEDEDLYRFLDDTERALGEPIERIADGRDVWEVFKDSRFLGNTRIDPCSRILKREKLRNWVLDRYDPADVVVHVGVDWTENHRLPAISAGWSKVGVAVDAPLCWEPMMGKHESAKLAEDMGIELPRLYEMGFSHNNCGGFCVKAGHAQFRLLLEKMPERYKWHEQKEEELREFLDKDVAILRDRTGGVSTPVTLRSFRERVEAEPEQLALITQQDEEWGGCSCFAPLDESFDGIDPNPEGRPVHIVSVSGGLGSFAAAHRVIEKYKS